MRRVLTFAVSWEYPSDEYQGHNFLALLATVRIHLPEDNYVVSVALPTAKSVLRLVDLEAVSGYIDMINLTTYDFAGPWSSKSGHHAQLYAMEKDEMSGSSAVKYLMSHGVPARKILMGIPLYGRSFLNVSGPAHKNRGSGGSDGFFEYKQLPRKSTKETVDKRAGAAQCVGGDGGFVTYDNPDTVKMKASFCKQKGLGVSRSFFFSDAA